MRRWHRIAENVHPDDQHRHGRGHQLHQSQQQAGALDRKRLQHAAQPRRKMSPFGIGFGSSAIDAVDGGPAAERHSEADIDDVDAGMQLPIRYAGKRAHAPDADGGDENGASDEHAAHYGVIAGIFGVKKMAFGRYHFQHLGAEPSPRFPGRQTSASERLTLTEPI